MAVKTATITARPTKTGAYTSSTYWQGVDEFLAGTGDMYTNRASGFLQRFLYGFDFEEIREIASKSNLKVIGLKVTSVTKSEPKYQSGSSPSSNCQFYFRFVTGFPTGGTTLSGSSDLGDSTIDMIETGGGSTTQYTTVTKTEADFPNALSWINSNLTSFLNGFTSNTFGVLFTMRYMRVKEFTITVTYEYEEGIRNILTDTAEVQKILLDTQEVKEVYIDKTKVFG